MARTTQSGRRPLNAERFHSARAKSARTDSLRFYALADWLWALAVHAGDGDEILDWMQSKINEYRPEEALDG